MSKKRAATSLACYLGCKLCNYANVTLANILGEPIKIQGKRKETNTPYRSSYKGTTENSTYIARN